jgi:hypothetical protein
MEFPWPQKGARLFVQEGNYHEFAHFGWGSASTQFVGYVEAYKEAADRLTLLVLESQETWLLDTQIFPILFLYRQYVELELKCLVLRYSKNSRNSKKIFLRKVSHNLLKLWNEAKKQILEVAGSEQQREFVATVEDYIKQFDELDRSSSSFRYPVTKGLELIHGEEKRINLRVVYDRMKELKNFFAGVDGQLSELRDFRMEIDSFLP